jgi:triosephosphate isomerase
MYKNPEQTKAFFHEFLPLVAGHTRDEIVVCPPYIDLCVAIESCKGSNVAIGAQNLYWEKQGAYTGEICPAMLLDIGCTHVIVGHSERRQYHGETDAAVAAKARAAWRAGLMAIICIGETEAQRMNGEALDVVARQIAGSVPQGATPANTAIAYEPVWAIGTGKTPTNGEIAQMHAHIRARVGGLRILYGGSVKPANAREILALEDVDGALVGGASLKAKDFLAIAESAARRS